MSDLQIGLIALGALLIVVVLALNWWQDRRVRRQMEASFSPEREDPLLAGTTPAPVKTSRKARATSVQPPEMATRREPALNGAPAEDEPAAGMRREPEIEAVSSARDDGEPDLACEAIIELQFPAPVAARDLLPLVRELDRVGQKPLRTFFQTVDGSQTANLRLDRDYASMRLAVLLANRSGALTSAEWAQAWGRAERIAERFDARIEGPDPAHVAEHARQLDEICASFDTQWV